MGVLGCVHSVAADLSALQQHLKVIPLPLETPLDLGRHCQFELFCHVLQSDQQLLSLLSRRHCRVQLSNREPPAPGSVAGATKAAEDLAALTPRGKATWLLVENLSANAISVDGHLLSRGSSRVMADGASLGFMRPMESTGKSETFLQFRLRRARVSGYNL